MKATTGSFMKLLSVLFILLLFGGSLKAQDSTYYFTCFGSDADQKLYVYSSSDGINFSLFSATGFGGQTGVLRDPALFHYNNKYYIAFTIQSWTTSSTAFAIASSSNLISWTTIATVDCGVPGTYFTWAPDWFVDDGKINLIVNIGPRGSMRPYIFTARDNTLTSWSTPVDIGIGTNHIDAYVVKTDTIYHCFCKDETYKNIVHFTSSSLTGTWTKVATLWNGYEGVCLIKQSSTWRIYVDRYSAGGGIYSATSSDLDTWSSLTKLNFGRHGSCLIKIPVTGISLSPVEDTILIQEIIQITPTIIPSDATADNITWRSYNGLVARVNAVGRVIGLKVGTAVVTATTLNGNKTASCTIVVIEDTVNTVTSVKHIKTPDDISVYLNPIDGKQLTIEGLTGNTVIRIVDINGHVEKEQSVFGEQRVQLDVNLNLGVYFIQVISSQKTIVKKILIK